MNATFEQIIARAEALGIPITEYEFKETKKNPAPAPPFIVYLKTERQTGPDGQNKIRQIDASIELYTDRKADPNLEARIEDEVLFDVEFVKQGVLIQSENMFQAAYDFSVVQKKR